MTSTLIPVTVPWAASGQCVLDSSGSGMVTLTTLNRFYPAWAITYGAITGSTNPVSVTFVVDGRTGQTFQGAQSASFTVTGIYAQVVLEFFGGTPGDVIRVACDGYGSTESDTVGAAVTFNSTFGASGSVLGTTNVLFAGSGLSVTGTVDFPLLPYTGPATIMVQGLLSTSWRMIMRFYDPMGNLLAGVSLIDQSTAIPLLNLYLPALTNFIRVVNADAVHPLFDVVAVAAPAGSKGGIPG